MCQHLFSWCVFSALLGLATAQFAGVQVISQGLGDPSGETVDRAADGVSAAPAPGARIKAASPAVAKEPISAERRAALQRTKLPLPLGEGRGEGAHNDHGRPAPPTALPMGEGSNPALMLDRVLFDQPGDGSLWAVGNTYKTSFTAEGFTYIPRFGPDAPRNFPIAFTLREVRVGDRALSLQAAAAQWHGDSVIFDRGALTEAYHLALESVEQTFTLNSRPAGGSLVIRMNVQTELSASERAEGLCFANDLGSVTYSSAVVVDAASRRTSVPTRLVQHSALSHQPSTV